MRSTVRSVGGREAGRVYHNRFHGWRLELPNRLHSVLGVRVKFGSLFSGIGGIDLGLERAGMECAFQVENEPYCLKVLAKHWPNVTRYEDIREVDFERVAAEAGVDLLAGGFPCQDLSYAGKGAGLSGERSGLWSEFVRAIRVVRPRYVLVENVPGLLSRGMGVVLGDLCALGYDAEWESIPAAAFGAPHLRWRVFIVAYAERKRCTHRRSVFEDRRTEVIRLVSSIGCDHRQFAQMGTESSFAVADEWRQPEPPVVGVVNGLPYQLERLRGLGNAVVPQKAEWLGRLILEHESQEECA